MRVIDHDRDSAGGHIGPKVARDDHDAGSGRLQGGAVLGVSGKRNMRGAGEMKFLDAVDGWALAFEVADEIDGGQQAAERARAGEVMKTRVNQRKLQ